ncbi:MAG: hypothetical protein JNM94_13615 [Phycisphaerae bacterium]|nr:hypothetical protein [Phycisphaerae bacterium]
MAAPPNDNCTGATPLSEPVTTFCTLGATTDGPPLPPECDEGFGLSFVSDVWFRFTAPMSGDVCISTCGTADFDTRLAIYAGDCSALSIVGCNDDAQGCELASELVVAVAAGETYLVRVGGYESSGCGSLSVSFAGCATCPPSDHDCVTLGAPGCNDVDCCYAVCAIEPSCCAIAWDVACVDATADLAPCASFAYSCNGAPTVPNDCAPECLPLVELGSVPFDTTLATTDGPPTDCDYAKDIWYCIVAPTTGQLEVTVDEASFDPTIAVYDLGTSGVIDPSALPQALLQCGDSRHDGVETVYVAQTSVGTTYLIQVAGSLSSGLIEAGTGEITVRFKVPLVNTGPTLPALYDPNASGAFSLVDLGFATGTLAPGALPSLFAQPFALPQAGTLEPWAIKELHVAACVPGTPGCIGACSPGGADCPPDAVANETLVVVVWNRKGLAPPGPGDQVAVLSFPFPTPAELVDSGPQNEDLAVKIDPPLELAPGDYWFTAFAENDDPGAPPAAIVWLTNASGDVLPVVGPAGPFVYRAPGFPQQGFVPYALDPATQLAPAPGDDPTKLYSQGFRIIGQLGGESICDRVRSKISSADEKLRRVEAKNAQLPSSNPTQFQQLSQAMFQQNAEARALIKDAQDQLEGASVPNPCPTIDTAGVIAKAMLVRDLLSELSLTLAALIADEEVTAEELAIAQEEIGTTTAAALVLLELMAQDASPCPPDLNGDGTVDGADLAVILGNWGSAGFGDLDESGAVDGGDLALILGAWGPCTAK